MGKQNKPVKKSSTKPSGAGIKNSKPTDSPKPKSKFLDDDEDDFDDLPIDDIDGFDEIGFDDDDDF